MCIRDRSGPHQGASCRRLSSSDASGSGSSRSQTSTGPSSMSCLLYTSDACRRIERCPSRGLGDVYKRQVRTPPGGFMSAFELVRCFGVRVVEVPDLDRPVIYV